MAETGPTIKILPWNWHIIYIDPYQELITTILILAQKHFQAIISRLMVPSHEITGRRILREENSNLYIKEQPPHKYCYFLIPTITNYQNSVKSTLRKCSQTITFTQNQQLATPDTTHVTRQKIMLREKSRNLSEYHNSFKKVFLVFHFCDTHP